MYQEALAEAQRAFEVSQHPWNRAQIADNLAHLGRRTEAEEILAEIQERVKRMTTAVEVAQTYAVLRRKEEALEWLEYAYQAHSPHLLLSINRNPDFAWLRAEQQFQDLVRRIGWPQ